MKRNKAISALTVDLFTRLDRSEVACPIDNVFDLLLRYGYEQTRPSNSAREDSIPTGFARRPAEEGEPASPIDIPAGWASQTMLRATGASELILDILESALATSPQPWNTQAGQSYLQAELAEFAKTWVELSTTTSGSGMADTKGTTGGFGFAGDVGSLTQPKYRGCSAYSTRSSSKLRNGLLRLKWLMWLGRLWICSSFTIRASW